MKGTFSNDDGDGNENVKKSIITTLHVGHAFLYISLPSLHDYSVNLPNSTIGGGGKQVTANVSFSF